MFRYEFILSTFFIIGQICNSFELKFLPSESLKEIQLFHNEKTFYVIKNLKSIEIPNYNLDPELRDISDDQLKGFLKNGYIHLKQIGEDEYILRANVNGNGSNIWIKFIVSMIIAEYLKHELKLVGRYFKDNRKEAAEELKHKAENQKTIKDRAYEIYDKVLFDGGCVSIIKWGREQAYVNKDIATYKLENIKETLENYQPQIRDEVVLQITERILKIQDQQQNQEYTATESETVEYVAQTSRVRHDEYKEKWSDGPFDNPRLNEINAENEKSSCIIS